MRAKGLAKLEAFSCLFPNKSVFQCISYGKPKTTSVCGAFRVSDKENIGRQVCLGEKHKKKLPIWPDPNTAICNRSVLVIRSGWVVIIFIWVENYMQTLPKYQIASQCKTNLDKAKLMIYLIFEDDTGIILFQAGTYHKYYFPTPKPYLVCAIFKNSRHCWLYIILAKLTIFYIC